MFCCALFQNSPCCHSLIKRVFGVTLESVSYGCVFIENGRSERGPADWRAGRVREDLQERYVMVLDWTACVACLKCNPTNLGVSLNPHCVSVCVCVFFMCVCAFNQHGLTMLMLAQYSMQEREPWKPTSRGSIVTPRRLMKGKPHVCNRHCRWKYLTRGHVSNRTGTRTKWGLMMDGWNSAIRYYKNNFSDGFRQVRLLQRKSYWSWLYCCLFVCWLFIK